MSVIVDVAKEQIKNAVISAAENAIAKGELERAD